MRGVLRNSAAWLALSGANASGGCGGGRVNHPVDFADFISRETGHLGVLPHNRFVFGHVDTENLILRYVGFYPLNVGSELREYLVRFLRSLSELLPLGRPNPKASHVQ